jgi:hypothetical protein
VSKIGACDCFTGLISNYIYTQVGNSAKTIMKLFLFIFTRIKADFLVIDGVFADAAKTWLRKRRTTTDGVHGVSASVLIFKQVKDSRIMFTYFKI